MEALHSLLAESREDVILRWQNATAGSLVSESLPAAELVDHLPTFLREIVAALRADAGLPTLTLPPEATSTASQHGEQRLRLGFSLDAVVREYGALRDAIIGTALHRGLVLTLRELEVVDGATVTGIAHAVTEYTRQRDAELQRQHNEHLAFIAHELRNPLSSAMIAVDLMKQTADIPGDSRALTALMRAHARMMELIDHSLDDARVASGIALRRQAVDLRSLLEETAAGSSFEALAKDIIIRSHVEEDATVQADLRLVRSALDNLVRNAVKFTARGGHVDLRAKVTAGHACIEIEDGCGGLPPGKVEQAFAPFVRLDNRESGFGLGLAIAKQAVDAHGGAIRVQNLPGKGCIFVLELPMAQVGSVEREKNS